MKIPYLVEVTAGSLIALHAIAADALDSSTPYAQIAQASSERITIGQAILIAEKAAKGEAVVDDVATRQG